MKQMNLKQPHGSFAMTISMTMLKIALMMITATPFH
jgi:hypothetical protein